MPEIWLKCGIYLSLGFIFLITGSLWWSLEKAEKERKIFEILNRIENKAGSLRTFIYTLEGPKLVSLPNSEEYIFNILYEISQTPDLIKDNFHNTVLPRFSGLVLGLENGNNHNKYGADILDSYGIRSYYVAIINSKRIWFSKKFRYTVLFVGWKEGNAMKEGMGININTIKVPMLANIL